MVVQLDDALASHARLHIVRAFVAALKRIKRHSRLCGIYVVYKSECLRLPPKFYLQFNDGIFLSLDFESPSMDSIDEIREALAVCDRFNCATDPLHPPHQGELEQQIADSIRQQNLSIGLTTECMVFCYEYQQFLNLLSFHPGSAASNVSSSAPQ